MNNNKEFILINKSVVAPVSGVYRYVLIPVKNSINYYIDLFYIFGQGSDEDVLNKIEDTIYLKKGERIIVNSHGKVEIEKKQNHLRLVVNNG